MTNQRPGEMTERKLFGIAFVLVSAAALSVVTVAGIAGLALRVFQAAAGG